MMTKMKITDGDFIMIEVGGQKQEGLKILMENVHGWLKKHGLNNCRPVIVPTDSKELNVYIFSVNDVFEEQVLKGDNK